MSNYRRKLIEVALPLKAINEASADEKAVPRRGHPQGFIFGGHGGRWRRAGRFCSRRWSMTRAATRRQTSSRARRASTGSARSVSGCIV